MVEFTTLLQNTFRKFQLRGEIALLDRESTNRQRAFGVELYDLIETQRVAIQKQAEEEAKESNSDPEKLTDDLSKVLRIFQNVENAIRQPLEACRDEIESMEASAPMPFPPVLIQRRKEEFGVEIWPIVSQPQWLHECLQQDLEGAMAEKSRSQNADGNTTKSAADAKKELGDLVNIAVRGVVKGTKTTIAKAIGRLSPEEREVEACVDRAKKDMALLETEKAQKFTEIEDLVEGGSTLECC